MKRKSKLLLVFLVYVIMLTLVSVVEAQETVEEFNVDVIVTYISDEGWQIVAKDGYQVTGNLKLYVYTNVPGVVSVTAVVENEKVLDVKEKIDFKKEYTLNLPKSKYGKVITFTIVMTWGRVSKTVTKSYTIVESPVPPNLALQKLFTPRQLERIIKNIKWDTVAKAFFFAIGGVAAAAFLKYYCYLLEPFNSLQLPLLGAAALAAFALEEDAAAGYFAIFAFADFISYRYVKGPSLLGILELRFRDRDVWDALLPVYPHEGRIAVALQSGLWAIRRLMGKHVYLEINGKIESLWKRNGTVDLIICEKAVLRKKPVRFHVEEEEMEEAAELTHKVEKREEWVLEVVPADVHTMKFIRNASYFTDLVKDYRKLADEAAELRAKLAVERKLGKMEALREWGKLVGRSLGAEA